ncbi:MT-A70-domain-containing protein [Naematelia encephala]|uniref:MT-A70-domain-containing protein n=1 Tax=Naematelia encephala TaxID=71784 RepID=A0A1Y2AUB1_9TREE|nr:MT-A70-domain-containing protein [Naematelia encephala]
MSTLAAHHSFLTGVLDRQSRRRQAVDPDYTYSPPPSLTFAASTKPSEPTAPSKENVVNYIKQEETIRNDYTTWYGVSGEFGSNYVLGAGDNEICEEYPALKKLMDLKSSLVAANSHPPLYLPLTSSSSTFITQALQPHKFDVILINTASSNWDETAALPIRALSADPGFVFLWVGSGDGDGLEKGRECFARWGFRRAEDIVWVKTNKLANGDELGGRRGAAGNGLFASQKEHCLMGIRGTVRRSTDTRFVHCNVDTDVLIWEDSDGQQFPPYLYTLIENFCLGTRRLVLFTPPQLSRRGWVTADTMPLPASTSTSTSATSEVQLFDSTTYTNLLSEKQDGKDILPFNHEVEMLRPKSPQRRGGPGTRGGSGGGGGGPAFRPGFRPQPRPPGLQFNQGGQGYGGQMQGMGGMMMPQVNMGMGMGLDPMAMMNMQMGMMGGMGGMQGMMPMQMGYQGMGNMGGYGAMDEQQLHYFQQQQLQLQQLQQQQQQQQQYHQPQQYQQQHHYHGQSLNGMGWQGGWQGYPQQ